MSYRCDCCGRFRRLADLFAMASEDDTWLECVDCVSPHDAELSARAKRRTT